MVESMKSGERYWCIKPYSNELNADPHRGPSLPWFGEVCDDTLLCCIDMEGRPQKRPSMSTYVSLNDLYTSREGAYKAFIEAGKEFIHNRQADIDDMEEEISSAMSYLNGDDED